MARRMTIIFDDDALHRALKVEAARQDRQLKDIVTEAVRDWLENQEDTDLLPIIEAARTEWQERGGIEAAEFFRTPIEERLVTDATPG